MRYKITKEQCRTHIFGVCSRCGGGITPMETVDNAGDPTFWPGCEKCMCFDHGVDRKIFKTAEKLVNDGYRHYSHIDHDSSDDEEIKRYKVGSQISGACGLVRDVLHIYEGI